jgi:acetyl-CoA synthetase
MDALLPTLYFGRPIVALTSIQPPEAALPLMQSQGVTHTFPTALKAMIAWPAPRNQFVRLKLQGLMCAGEAVGDVVFATAAMSSA